MLQLLLPGGYMFNMYDYGTSYVFKIYNPDDTAFDATTYNAPIIHILDEFGNLVINEITGSWTTQASGIGSFSFSSTNRMTTSSTKGRNYFIQVQLEKSGVVLTTDAQKIYLFKSVD